MGPLGYFLLSTALTAAGAIVSNKADAAAASRKRRAIQDQDANQDPFRQKASQKIRDTADQFDPNLRKTRREKADVEALKKYSEISDKNKEFREGTIFADGNITEMERYDKEGKEDREARRIRDMTNAARFFSPTQANITERQMIGEMGGDLDTNRNFARGQFNVDQQIIDSIRPNAGMKTLGAILSGMGTAVGFYGAGANFTAQTAAKEAAKKAAEEAAIQGAIGGTTAARFGLGEAGKAAASVGPSIFSTAAPATAPAIGSGAGMFGFSPAMQDKLAWTMAPSTQSTARNMFGANTIAPFGAANMGPQSRSYQLWNLPYR